MSTTENTSDPIAEAVRIAREAEQGGIEALRELRDRNSATRAARAAELAELQAAEDAEQAEAEAIFAAAEAEDRRQRDITAASDQYQQALNAYTPIADHADDLISQLHGAIAKAIELATSAILQERVRDTNSKPLASAHAQLAAIVESAPPLNVPELRLHAPQMTDPVGLVTIAAMLTDPRLADQKQDAERLVDVTKRRPAMPNVIISR